MERYHVASFKQGFLIVDGMHASGFDGFFRAECIVGIHIHVESFCYAGHVAPYIAECKDAEFLSFEFRSRLAIVEIADSKHQQSEHQLGNGI